VQYVSFAVAPTAADSAKYSKIIADLLPEFQSTTNDSNFVERNFGFIDGAYFQKSDVSAAIADTVFSMAAGTVYGPYIDNGAYMAVKLLDRKVIPDSVRSRHILIQANTPLDMVNAQNRVDSLKGLIEAGTHRFDSLAAVFGSDATREKGGDLDFAGPGMMVKPFNDLIFYTAEPGKLYTVVTQFGVHLVEVTARKYINNTVGVKLAYLSEQIVPSEETQATIKDKAIAMMGSSKSLDKLLEAAKKDAKLKIGTTPLFESNDFRLDELGSGQTARDIVRWAFTADKGEVSPEVYAFQNPELLTVERFVLAGLKSVQAAGLPSVDNIREAIKQQVINKKKGEALVAKMKDGSLESLASKFNSKVDTLTGISFASSFLPELGAEPKVVAAAAALAVNKRSAPIVGNSGVFVVVVTEKQPMTPASDLAVTKRSIASPNRAQIPGLLMPALVKKADVKDQRSNFY